MDERAETHGSILTKPTPKTTRTEQFPPPDHQESEGGKSVGWQVHSPAPWEVGETEGGCFMKDLS